VAPTLVFDGDCRFCTSSARWLQRRLPDEVSVVPWQRADLEALGVTADEARAAVQWVGPAGRASGAAAVGRALEAAGGVWRPFGRLCRTPPTAWVAEVVYRVVARNRHRLPGGTPACRLDGASGGDRGGRP
jgi:predicted DCC family thiol-disulfide oxidoreductase YuxK